MTIGWRLRMFEVLKKLGMKQYDSGIKQRRIALVRCLTCGEESEMLHQNAMKSNRKGGKYCAKCYDPVTHNMSKTIVYRKWRGMWARSEDTLDKNYGARGITVCKEWRDFAKFWEDMGPTYQEGLTIERIDVNGSYCKENCTWITMFDQQSNKRMNRKMMYEGEMIHLAELCRRTGLTKIVLVTRLNQGMSVEEAIHDAKNTWYKKPMLYQGELLHLAEICRRSSVGRTAMVIRLQQGMTPDEAAEDAKKSPRYGRYKRKKRTSTT
jgi:hypothetical protein